MIMRPAKTDEIALLVDISKRAFDSDVNVGGDQPGGPPCYDEIPWHEQMMNEGHLFTLLVENKPVGGILLFADQNDSSVMYVGRIFIDPKHFRKGYGAEGMKAAEQYFPGVKSWRLETPIWNVRTNSFYPKLGYVEQSRDEESVYFEKTI